jgi:pheromone a factor receptor
MSRNDGSFLLDDGDELSISGHVTLIYHEIEPAKDYRLTFTQEREKQLFASRYHITGRLLGIGGYGKVLVGIHQRTRRQLACKVVNLRELYDGASVANLRLPVVDHMQNSLVSGGEGRGPSKVDQCFRECRVLRKLSHPNIVSIKKVFWSSNTIYLFEELVTGGDLFSYIEYKGGRLVDVESAVIVRQILKGIKYLHDQGVIHRDLKPDNVLMTSLEDGARVVITDFGNARCLPRSPTTNGLHGRMFSLVGTVEYAAPEIYSRNPAIPPKQGYSKAVDMWSIGVITAALLTGEVIFTDRGHPNYNDKPFEVVITLAAKCDISIMDDKNDPSWKKVGDRPKNFIKRLLVLREEDRMTATQALAHPWFSNTCHAAEFDALYKRTIKDWKPRPEDSSLVERLPEVSSEHTQSAHFASPHLQQSVADGRANQTAFQHPSLKKLPSAPAEEYEESHLEGPGSYHQQVFEYGTNDSSYTKPPQLSRSASIGNSIKQFLIDSDPPASGMYSTYKAQERYVYEERMGNMVIEDTPQDGDSRPCTPEPLLDSLIVHETPINVARKRPRSA